MDTHDNQYANTSFRCCSTTAMVRLQDDDCCKLHQSSSSISAVVVCCSVYCYFAVTCCYQCRLSSHVSHILKVVPHIHGASTIACILFPRLVSSHFSRHCGCAYLSLSISHARTLSPSFTLSRSLTHSSDSSYLFIKGLFLIVFWYPSILMGALRESRRIGEKPWLLPAPIHSFGRSE
jgi:hypothetical protein